MTTAPAPSLVPLPPGTQVFAVLEQEDRVIIDGPLTGLALAVRAPFDEAAAGDHVRVLTLDPTSPSPDAQLAWFRVGVDAAFSHDAAERLAGRGPAGGRATG